MEGRATPVPEAATIKRISGILSRTAQRPVCMWAMGFLIGTLAFGALRRKGQRGGRAIVGWADRQIGSSGDSGSRVAQSFEGSPKNSSLVSRSVTKRVGRPQSKRFALILLTRM